MGRGAEVAWGRAGHTHSCTQWVAVSSHVGLMAAALHGYSPRSFRAARHGQQQGQASSAPLTRVNSPWGVTGGRPQVSAREPENESHFHGQVSRFPK